MASNTDKRRSNGSGGSRSSQQQYRAHNSARCFCKMRAVIRVSGTDANPGRLFYGCPKLRVNERCGFFLWVDNESGLEDTYSVNEATFVMATASLEDEEWRRIMTQKLCNLEIEIMRVMICIMKK
ncbi:Zinc finger, GRF-type [Sesbania bispinosa]|nr:Zinc finger, GRF-type [Sesbania bispinosa]